MADANKPSLPADEKDADKSQNTPTPKTTLSNGVSPSPDTDDISDREQPSDRKRARSVIDGDTTHNTEETSPKGDGLLRSITETEIAVSHLNEVNNTADNQEKKTFWKTLSFWQRASLDENEVSIKDVSKIDYTESNEVNKEPNQEIDVESPQKDSENPLKTTITNHPTTTVTQHIVQSNVSREEETCISAAQNQQVTIDEEAIKFTEDESIEEHQGSIWNITRRVSYLQFLQPKVGETSETFVPNKLSQVIDTNQQVVNEVIRNNSASSETTHPQNIDIGSWWLPWKWDFSKKENDMDGSASDLGSGVVEDELLKLQRKEVTNQIKLLSYGIPKSTIWGSQYHDGDDHCNVHITGSYRKPVVMKHLPQSAFEVSEKSLQKKKDTETTEMDIVESIVLPDIRWNYRNLTWRTKCRITLSKLPKLDTVFLPQKHLYMNPSATKRKRADSKISKKAVVLSFHGFLPQKIVRNIIGEPSGNAEQMSGLAVDELKRWADINNVELDINVINIEGHGKIFELVNGCLSFLDNFMDIMKSSDFLLCVANSHNVPVAIHTIAKLVTSGYLDNVDKLGLINMSGLCLGPVPEIESRISTRGSVGNDNEIIGELFDLEDPDLLQGKELIRSMKILIKKNFKVTFIGALKDCFSPLYSSLALNFNHPNIYRAIYVDKENHQPDFLISLFNLILSMKNLNHRDHGLLVELSNFFVGAVGEGGHYKLLQNKYCYRVGINNMLNTCDLFYEQELKEELTNAKEFTANSYHIPWCLRGLLEELDKVKSHLDTKQIVEQLYQEFKSWDVDDPRNKELRYCMGAFENVLNEDLGF